MCDKYVSIIRVLTKHTSRFQNKSLKSQAGHTCIQAHTLKLRSGFGVPGLCYCAAVTAAATGVPPTHELIPGTPTVKVICKFPETCHSVPCMHASAFCCYSTSGCVIFVHSHPHDTHRNTSEHRAAAVACLPLAHTLKIATLMNFLQREPAARETR